MIRIRDEGSPVRTGFNVYPCSSGSIGFIFSLGDHRYMLRYSRITGRFFSGYWRNA